MPNFYLLGFQRCGTSTINNYLLQTHLISLPKIKETHFYSNDDLYRKGINWYLNQFNNNNKYLIKGEIDPSYIIEEKNLNRIKITNNNDIKFIFIFRKPLERSYSHYMLSKYRGYEEESFISSLEKEEDRLNKDIKSFSLYNHSYLKRSNYIDQLNIFNEVSNDSKKLYLFALN